MEEGTAVTRTCSRVTRASVMVCGTLAFVAVAVVRAQQPPPPSRGGPPQALSAPTGPTAAETYMNIQVLKDIPADQLDLAMRFVAASLGFQCGNCHVQEATGEWSYAKDDKPTKNTAREMMKMVSVINAENFNGQVRITCSTCHVGHNQPQNARPPLAEMLTPEQIAAMAARQGRGPQGPPGGPGVGGAPPAGRGQGQPGQPGPAGPPQQPVVALDDVLTKFLDALGGRSAIETLRSVVISGTMTTRAAQSMAFTIEEKGPNRYRETQQTQPAPAVRAFDGTDGWAQVGTRTTDLTGFQLQQALRIADLGLPLQLKDKYQGLAPRRGTARIDGREAYIVTGRPAPGVAETLYFDVESGLLVRRGIATSTPLGQLAEQIDYRDYRGVAGVKMPFQITRTNWNTLDTLTVTEITPNAPIDDARFAKPK